MSTTYIGDNEQQKFPIRKSKVTFYDEFTQQDIGYFTTDIVNGKEVSTGVGVIPEWFNKDGIKPFQS